MKIELDIKKRYIVIAVCLIAIIGVVLIAYAGQESVPNPGHSGDEVVIQMGGTNSYRLLNDLGFWEQTGNHPVDQIPHWGAILHSAGNDANTISNVGIGMSPQGLEDIGKEARLQVDGKVRVTLPTEDTDNDLTLTTKKYVDEKIDGVNDEGFERDNFRIEPPQEVCGYLTKAGSGSFNENTLADLKNDVLKECGGSADDCNCFISGSSSSFTYVCVCTKNNSS